MLFQEALPQENESMENFLLGHEFLGVIDWARQIKLESHLHRWIRVAVPDTIVLVYWFVSTTQHPTELT